MPYGQDAKFGIAFQNSHGTAADTASLYLIPFLSQDLGPSRPELLSENMEGRYDEGEAYAGPRNVGGTILSESQPVPAGVFLKAILGAPTTVSNSVAAGEFWTHTFKPRTADFDTNVVNNPLTIYKNLADGGQVPLFKDVVGTRLELAIANGEFLKMGLSLTGGAVDTKTTSIDLGSVSGKKWTWDVSSLQLGGVANTDFADLTIIIDEQSSPRWSLQAQQDPDRVKRDNRRQIRVNGTVKFTDQTEYDIFIANTTQALDLTMTGTVEIRSGFFDVIRVVMPAFKYLTYPLDHPDASEFLVRFEGKGDYHTGSGTSVEITLTNTQNTF
jgi:hypothetical protein